MHRNPIIPQAVEEIARRDGVLDFKREGENGDGRSIGKLTLRSTTEPVYADGRWVTRNEASRLARRWGVDLFEL